jgi:periplasmic copper chaperone A
MCNGISIACYKKCLALTMLLLMLLTAQQSVAQLDVENAWIKLAPPTASVNAAYMELTNTQPFAQTIVDISADCCAGAMLHQTRVVDDKASMEHLSQITLAAQSSLQLGPLGTHIMLMNSNKNLVEGEQVELTFSFSNGAKQIVTLAVKKDEE